MGFLHLQRIFDPSPLAASGVAKRLKFPSHVPYGQLTTWLRANQIAANTSIQLFLDNVAYDTPNAIVPASDIAQLLKHYPTHIFSPAHELEIQATTDLGAATQSGTGVEFSVLSAQENFNYQMISLTGAALTGANLNNVVSISGTVSPGNVGHYRIVTVVSGTVAEVMRVPGEGTAEVAASAVWEVFAHANLRPIHIAACARLY